MNHLQRFQNALKDAGAEAALISSEINQRYLSDFPFSDGYILVTPDEGFLLTDSRYIEAAKNSVKDFSVILPRDGMLNFIKGVLSEKGISELAIEEDELSCSSLKKFTETFEGVEMKFGASDILRSLRAVKTEDEIKRIAEAQKLTDEAFLHILDFITPRRTEREVALELEFFMRKRGAEGVAFETIAVSGPASSLPHGVPSDVTLRPGFLTMDFGAKVDGYCSDMTRTVVIGKADEEIRRVYDTVLTAQQTALSMMRGGVSCFDADKAARDVIREAGFGANFGHSLGHGVGMFIHEFPSLSPKADPSSVLVQGNVVTVEPGIYIEGKYGCRIEDMVTIAPDGSLYNFTKSKKDLIEIL